MPASYTHYAIARETFDKLSPPIRARLRPHLPLYFFGAQGADFCFLYRFLNPQTPNFGSYLHRYGAHDGFSVMRAFSVEPAIFAYSLGYVTHYASDVTFHPFVYALAGKSKTQHSRIENVLDGYFKAAAPKNDLLERFYKTKPNGDDLNSLFFLYAAIAAKIGFPPLKKNAFARAIFLFNAYLPITSVIFGNENKRILSLALNAEKRLWSYPAAPHVTSRDGGKELFQKSVDLSLRLIEEFTDHCQQGKTPSKMRFGKNLLTAQPAASR